MSDRGDGNDWIEHERARVGLPDPHAAEAAALRLVVEADALRGAVEALRGEVERLERELAAERANSAILERWLGADADDGGAGDIGEGG